ncbi:hypothetical protein GH808_00675 [Acetobacterium fimetarium]|uniref:Uncharacterized protein n=1 Tax=Acetobacterium fimetarium TaxID=52691 RepID=A0ABR6WQS9_9FIRM|nr:hypothetical protein [Acetobacterium fimetarium]MBC3802957.1 hypothetical protein [Acetobacterium fimetarium]
MLIVLAELSRHFTEENINATVVKIIQQTIHKDIQILEGERPENRGLNYYVWKKDVAALKAVVEEFDELYELLDQRLPIYEEKCQLLYKDKSNWRCGKHDEVDRHIDREWIIEKHWEFRQKLKEYQYKNSELMKNKSKAEKEEYLNTIRFMENKQNEFAAFIDFIDNELKDKLNNFCEKVSNSKRLSGLTFELEEAMLLNHLRSSIPNQKVSKVNMITGQPEIHVFYGKDTCLSKGHKIENVKAVIKNLKNGLNDVMNIMYCHHCKQYRISFLSYQNYTKNNIIPAVIIKTVKSAEANGLKEHSILSLYGYAVGLTGLSKDVRQRILAYLLDAQIATKAQILDLLRFDITYTGKRKGMEESVRNWNTDIRFVNDYKISKQRVVRGGDFVNAR